MGREILVNRHHILYTRNEWNDKTLSKTLRNNRGLIVNMLSDVHNEMHKDENLWGGVPLLGKTALEYIFNNYTQTDKVLGNIAALMTLVKQTDDPDKEKFLEHVNHQLSYIRQGIVEIDKKRGHVRVGRQPTSSEDFTKNLM